jgi:hypothetical protein
MDLPSKKLVIILAALKQQHGEQFEGCGVAFDGRAIVCKCDTHQSYDTLYT